MKLFTVSLDLRNLLFSTLLLVVFVSCASSPEPEPEPVDLEAATPLFVPEQEDTGFFSFSDSSIMKDMEIGSPASIQRAASKIRTPSTQPERVILAVASSLMSIVWPRGRGVAFPAEHHHHALGH